MMVIMSAMRPVLSWLDDLNAAIGRLCGWLLAAMVVIQCLVVVLRYAFDAGFLWMQESVIYLHAFVALIACGYALAKSSHVRVDVFYRRFSPRGRAWIDGVGILFLLLPFCILVVATGLPFSAASWRVLEGSAQPSGLPAVYLLKSLIPAFAILLALQALRWLARLLIRRQEAQGGPPPA